MADSTLNSFLAQGTAAARAAFTPSPPTPASGAALGYLWYETDTSKLWAYDSGGTSWTDVTGSGGGGLSPPVTISTYNSGNALTLTTPNPTSATYDTTPIAALYINGPAAATTRNFISGIWIDTNASATDKGRGLAVHNTGASDSIYCQQDGVNSTGLAILLTTSGTGAFGQVIGTTLSTHTGLVVRQETAVLAGANCATLLSLDAEGSATEMMKFNSSVNSQSGLIFRLLGTGANPIRILGAADVLKAGIDNTGAMTVLSVSNQAGSDLTIATGDTNKNIVFDPNGSGVVRIIGSDGLPGSIPTLGTKDFLQMLNNGNANISWVVGTAGAGSFKFFENGGTVQYASFAANASTHSMSISTGDGVTGPTARFVVTTTGNLVVGNSAVETGLTGAGGIRVTSATDASSGAGSIVTLGGIYATKSLYADGGITTNAQQTVKVTSDTSTALTLDGTHFVVTLNNASPVTVTLPALSGITGRTYRVKNIGAGTATVVRAGTDNIFSTSSITSFDLAKGDSVDLVAGSSYWFVM